MSYWKNFKGIFNRKSSKTRNSLYNNNIVYETHPSVYECSTTNNAIFKSNNDFVQERDMTTDNFQVVPQDAKTENNQFNFLNLSINEIRSMLDTLCGLDVQELTINEIKKLLKDDHAPEQMIGDYTVKYLIQKISMENCINKDQIETLPLEELCKMLETPSALIFSFLSNNGNFKPKFTKNMEKQFLRYNSTESCDKSSVEDAAKNSNTCKICWEHEIDCVFIECGHLLSCCECAKTFIKCPICRKRIQRVLRVYKV